MHRHAPPPTHPHPPTHPTHPPTHRALPPRPPSPPQVLAQVRALSLDDSLVSARERARWAATGGSGASLPITAAYVSLCWVLDFLYAGRPIQRFWILETVARMPYFVYISMVGGGLGGAGEDGGWAGMADVPEGMRRMSAPGGCVPRPPAVVTVGVSALLIC